MGACMSADAQEQMKQECADAHVQLKVIVQTNLELKQAQIKVNALLMERSQSQRRDQEKIKALRRRR